MILSYQSLVNECLDGLLDDFDYNQIQPASVDLRLAQNITLNPLEFKLASTLEYVSMCDYFVGRVEGKSSLGRLGLGVHITAGFIDPGFQGNITLELFNFSDKVISLSKGDFVCQLCLEELDEITQKVYGECGNHYQGQTGITKSYLEKE